MRILTRKKFQDNMAKTWSEAVETEFKAQIDEAVLAEREACANICEELELPEWPDKVRQPLAQAIRARGQA